jgi:hypothetical protein
VIGITNINDISWATQALSWVQEFLRVPVRRLMSKQVKVHMRPLPDLIKNREKVSIKLNRTEFAHFLDGLDFIK